MPLDSGEQAPDFDLPGAGGGQSHCPASRVTRSCSTSTRRTTRAAAPSRRRASTACCRRLRRGRRRVIGVSPDSVKSHDKFRTKYGLTFPLASDEAKACSRPTASGSRRACTAASTWASSDHDPDRPRGPHRADLAEGEGAGPRRGGSGRGARPDLTRAQLQRTARPSRFINRYSGREWRTPTGFDPMHAPAPFRILALHGPADRRLVLAARPCS